MKVLLVEDERDLSRALSKILTINKYEVDCAFDGLEALNFVASYTYDAIIMDIMMPKMDGITALKEIRAKGNNTPIIMLTAKNEINDKLAGLDNGADDYLTKPFMAKELMARLRAITRRKGEIFDSNKIGNTTLNPNNYTISAEGEVRLTNKEYKLLDFLVRNKSTLLSSMTILDNVWEYDTESEINTVWVYISTLRKKLESINSNFTIKAVRGLGYKLEEKKEEKDD